jgi:adenylate cyclase
MGARRVPGALRAVAPSPSLARNLAIAALVAGLVAPLSFVGPVRLAEDRLYDVLSTLDPPLPPEPGVTIVAVDEPSFAEIGQRWPWPRSLHAELVRRLREAGARVIGLDILFADPSSPEADAALADAMGPDVLLAADDVTTRLDQGVQTTRVAPLDLLVDRQARVGVTSVDLDPDGYQRRMPETPDGFAAEALRMAGGLPEPAPPGALIQTFGPARTYPTVSYYQALDPARFLPPGRLKDRVVFVGLSLKAAPDAKVGGADAFLTSHTVSSGTLVSGAEVQATILDNLRHRLFVTPVPRAGLAGLVAAAALAAALVLGRRTTWRTGLGAAAALAGTGLGAYALLRYGRIWAPPLLPAGAMAAVFGAGLGLDFVRERHLRRQVSAAFSRYLSPDLVAELARNPAALKLGGERRDLTVLFCDVRGFTTMSERLKDEPERLTALINRLLDALSAAVVAEGGTIDKYMGDCVMAFWNAPLPSPDHPVRAARAALAMVEAVRDLNAALARETGDASLSRFAVGVGLNTGECVVGNLGSRWRYDYSVLGDAVNLASRLEGLSKELGAAIILGPETAARIGGDFVLIELDRIAVRGRAEATAVHTILAPAARRADPDLALLQELHPRLLAALRSGAAEPARDLLARCRTLAPQLAPYYERLAVRYGLAGREAGPLPQPSC